MIYMCERCEIEYGEPQPDCDNDYCGRDYSEVKDKLKNSKGGI